MSSALVTGGTGLVGSQLLYLLSRENSSVRALYRGQADRGYVKNVFQFLHPDGEEMFKRIEWVEGDVNDVPSLDEAMQHIDHVYHCAALISFQKKDRLAMEKTNVEGTANVVNCALNNGIKKLGYISSIAALGRTGQGETLTENSDWKYSPEVTRYSVSKYNAEREVWRGSEEGLPMVIVNPAVILGPCDWNKNTGAFFKKVHDGFNHYTTGVTGFVDAADVARAIFGLVRSEIQNEKFLLSERSISYQQLFTLLAEKGGYKAPSRNASYSKLEWAWRLEALASRFTGRPPRINKEAARASLRKNMYDGSKILNRMDFTYTPLEETVQKTWAFLRTYYMR